VHSLTRMMSLSVPAELESFLTQIYKAIAGKYTVTQKLGFLDYFETLCTNADSANILVNSSLITLFVSIVRSNKYEVLKSKTLHIIGVLIRHATVIFSNLQYVFKEYLCVLTLMKGS
jgi:serine/threonine-protein kinase ULK4